MEGDARGTRSPCRSPTTRASSPTAAFCRSSFPWPTTPRSWDRQGPDVGPQYRSAIFPNSADQAGVAKAYIEQITQARVFPRAIATRIEPGAAFYPAEPYHQDFLTRHPDHPYIVFNDLPKLKDLQKMFPDFGIRAQPVLVGSKRWIGGQTGV